MFLSIGRKKDLQPYKPKTRPKQTSTQDKTTTAAARQTQQQTPPNKPQPRSHPHKHTARKPRHRKRQSNSEKRAKVGLSRFGEDRWRRGPPVSHRRQCRGHHTSPHPLILVHRKTLQHPLVKTPREPQARPLLRRQAGRSLSKHPRSERVLLSPELEGILAPLGAPRSQDRTWAERPPVGRTAPRELGPRL